ncbi:MAG: glycosyltransferase family 39 protein [Vicingaceae bacterium]
MKLSIKQQYFFLSLILALNAYLRFFGLGDFSLSNDELSAVVRLRFDGFSDLISQGVIATDPHPAAAQILMFYWTKVAGFSPFSIRFPFALLALCSYLFLFDLFKNWFGPVRALLATAFISLTAFSIIHGQLARPYAIGLFATAAFVWSWNKLLFSHKSSLKYTLAYILSGALACYIHYFAGLFAGIVALIGIYSAVRNKRFTPFLLANVGVLLLFSPHIPITLAQLSREDITAWIPPVEWDFIFEHIFTLLNRSALLSTLFTSLLIFSLITAKNKTKESKMQIYFCLLFFAAPMIIGYLYTILVGPALMDRVLIFSAPYFLVLPFALLPELNKKTFYLAFALALLLPALSTVIETPYSARTYTENFRDIAIEYKGLANKYSSNDLAVFGNYNSPWYLEYYTGKEVPYLMSKLDKDSLLAQYMHKVRSSNSQAVFLSYACTYQPIECLEYVRLYYPELEDLGQYYNSGFWLFTRHPAPRDTVFSTDFHPDSSGLVVELTGNSEFFNLFQASLSMIQGTQVVNASAAFNGAVPDGAMIVVELKSPTGDNLLWKGKKLHDFMINGQTEIFTSILLPTDLDVTCELKVYLWNPGFSNLKVTSAFVMGFKDTFYPDLY